MYALILAGGKGERLRPLTDSIPKPLVPLDGKPILWHQVQWLKQLDVTHVIFLVGYRWEMVREYFGDGSNFGIKPVYSVETRPLGRGGAIRAGLAHVPPGEDSVIVLNGDIITDQDPADIYHRHLSTTRAVPDLLATIMVVPMTSPYGLVDLDPVSPYSDTGPNPAPAHGEPVQPAHAHPVEPPHQPVVPKPAGTSTGSPHLSVSPYSDTGPLPNVVAFREKVQLPHWINAGVYIFDPAIAPLLPELGDHELSTFPHLAQNGQIAAFPSHAFWRSIDGFKDLSDAQDFIIHQHANPSAHPEPVEGPDPVQGLSPAHPEPVEGPDPVQEPHPLQGPLP